MTREYPITPKRPYICSSVLLQKTKTGMKAGPWLLGFFAFVLIGSGELLLFFFRNLCCLELLICASGCSENPFG